MEVARRFDNTFALANPQSYLDFERLRELWSRTEACGGDRPVSCNANGSDVPSNWCCKEGEQCQLTDFESSALCCPGTDCNSLGAINCNLSLQDANTNLGPIFTTRLDDQAITCGEMCCPFGYMCGEADMNHICVLNKTSAGEFSLQSSDPQSGLSSTASSTSIRSSTTSFASTDARNSIASSLITSRTAQLSASGDNYPASTPTSTDVVQPASTLSTAGIAGIGIAGAALGALTILLVLFILRKKKHSQIIAPAQGVVHSGYDDNTTWTYWGSPSTKAELPSPMSNQPWSRVSEAETGAKAGRQWEPWSAVPSSTTSSAAVRSTPSSVPPGIEPVELAGDSPPVWTSRY